MKKKGLLIVSLVLLAVLVAGILVYFLSIRPAQLKKQEQQALVEAYRDEKFARYAQENQQYADYEVDVAFLGDSLTDGWDLEAWFPQFVVSNRGIGGDTSFTLEERLQISVYDLKPKVAVMLIGGNNPDTMLENYERILIGLRDNLPQTKIVLLSMTSMSQEWGKWNCQAAYNNVVIEKLAEKYGFTFIDLYSPLMDVETGQLREEYTFDGGHLTAAGYEVVVAQVTPVLEALLGSE